MLFRTHLSFSFLIGLIVLYFVEFSLLPYLLILFFSTLIIDIDTTKSFFGRRFKLVSRPISFLFGHRKLVHSLLFLVVVGFFIWVFLDLYFLPFIIGGLSHLFLDSLTKQGINFFYPWQFHVKGFINTGGFLEKMLFLLFFAGDVLLVFMKVL